MNKRNMKIEINESQSLDEVVMELERLGYVKREFAVFHSDLGSFVITRSYGIITWCGESLVSLLWCDCELATLAELKQMV